MNVRLRHNMLFTAGVFYDGEMKMNHYSLTLQMTTNCTDSDSHNVAFERLKYFVYNKMDSTIFINRAYQDQCQKFVDSGLTVTTMPGEPVDQLIGLMLYYKLNAIMEDRIVIDETEISSVLGDNMTYLHSSNEMTDVDSPPDWWYTADQTHSDYVSISRDKIVDMHASTAWRELGLNWSESESSTETGNIVVFADFNNNGKK
jgi:hypothetical protein